MSAIIAPFIGFLHQLASIVPVPIFTFLGALIEEIVAPIPSPLVMTLAGSLVATNQQGVAQLIVLAVIGAVGKALGSIVIYVLADKGEDFVMKRFGWLLGISHKEVEDIGKHLTQGKRDDIILFLLRAIPIIPTAPVSIVCGLIKYNFKRYITVSFAGTLVRNIFYLYLGFTSVGALESVNSGLDSVESIGYAILFVLFLAMAVMFYIQRKRGTGLKILSRLTKKADEPTEK